MRAYVHAIIVPLPEWAEDVLDVNRITVAGVELFVDRADIAGEFS